MITWLELALAVLPYSLLAGWYAFKAAVHRRLASAVILWMSLGWAYALGRDAHLFSRVSAAVLVSIAGLMGWLALMIIANVERQR